MVKVKTYIPQFAAEFDQSIDTQVAQKYNDKLQFEFQLFQ